MYYKYYLQKLINFMLEKEMPKLIKEYKYAMKLLKVTCL